MVQAFAPHAADQAFHIRILPRAPWRRNDLFHAHRRHGRAERLPVCAVPVADQVPRRRAPRECLSDLLCDPRHRRVRRYTEMHDLAALVVEHDEPEQEVERGRGDHEEIDRRQAIGVICKECPPRVNGGAKRDHRRRCKKGPLGGCGLVPVVHGRAPRTTRRALNRLTRRRAREGPVGPRGQAWAGWSVQLAVGV